VALLGGAVLAIWNGIDDAAEADFVRWHIKEHIPERVGLPGFRRGRRYVALEGTPKFFNFYETDTVETLTSESYIARLNAPTPWTRQVIAQFRDTIRTACRVVASSGVGQGAWIEAVRIASGADERALGEALERRFVDRVMAFDGVVAAHVLKGQADQSRRNTTESALRGSPDRLVDWVVLIEAAEAESLRAIRNTAVWTEILGDAVVERGIYRLQYALSREDLALRADPSGRATSGS
jgi:hypothetical protein